ncbi:Methylosome subunit pICln [Liparis tanakae]|uniref:Methylosome subunit pICln n=1 Tax=Liparis tanakae TaxID=230148 RepID=A0A4Z2IIF1_9TELE|nr:Methylosome subunit pICln [Liparis tanakae]
MVLLTHLRPPTEGVRHEQAETTAVMDGQKVGCGTLFVAETRLSWFDGSGMGFFLEYPTIGLHAISRDVSAYPQEHLYVMVNGKLAGENGAAASEGAADIEEEEEEDADGGSNDGDDEDDLGAITEIRFVPSDQGAFIELYHKHGHADIPTFYTCDEGLSSLTHEGHATLERLEGMLAQSVTQQYQMAGVRTEETNPEHEGLGQHTYH